MSELDESDHQLDESGQQLDESDLEGVAPDVLRRLAESRARGPRSRRQRPERESPQPVSRLLAPLFRKWGIKEQVARAATLREWADRVGPRIAERTRPVRLNEGTLFVAVESSSWMMELQMMKRELLERINAGRRSGRIEDIVFVQGEGRRGRGEERETG